MSSEAEGETKEALASSTYRTSAERVGANSGDLMIGQLRLCVCGVCKKAVQKNEMGKEALKIQDFES